MKKECYAKITVKNGEFRVDMMTDEENSMVAKGKGKNLSEAVSHAYRVLRTLDSTVPESHG
jgi:hypothetical protein